MGDVCNLRGHCRTGPTQREEAKKPRFFGTESLASSASARHEASWLENPGSIGARYMVWRPENRWALARFGFGLAPLGANRRSKGAAQPLADGGVGVSGSLALRSS